MMSVALSKPCFSYPYGAMNFMPALGNRILIANSAESLNIWWPMPLFLDIYFIYRYIMEVDEEQIYIQ
jgi:hypothetical protein